MHWSRRNGAGFSNENGKTASSVRLDFVLVTNNPMYGIENCTTSCHEKGLPGPLHALNLLEVRIDNFFSFNFCSILHSMMNISPSIHLIITVSCLFELKSELESK